MQYNDTDSGSGMEKKGWMSFGDIANNNCFFFSRNFVCLVALSFYFPKAHILFHIICFPLLLNCHFNCHKQSNYSLYFLLIWYVQKYPSKGVNVEGGILKWWKIFVSFPLQKISIFSKKKNFCVLSNSQFLSIQLYHFHLYI